MERKLTTKEIDNILDFLYSNTLIPKETADSILEITKKACGKRLSEIKINPKHISKLKDALKSIYFDSLISPGEAVGIIAGQSICERQTQGNLNTFHKAGSGDKQTTTQQFAEFLNATDNPKNPSYFIRLKEGNDSLENLRKTVGHSITEITIKKLAKSYEFFTKEKIEPWYEGWFILKNEENFDMTCKISIKIKMQTLYTYRITLIEIAELLMKKVPDIFCIPSPDCFATLDIFPDFSDVKFDPSLVLDDETEEEVYLREVLKPTIDNIVLCGISGVEDIYFLKEADKSWCIETKNSKIRHRDSIKGKKKNNKKVKDTVTTFKKMLALPFVDMSRCFSVNIWDIYHTFGIEAVREHLIVEMEKLMTGINKCHILLLVDKMTFNGSIASISRYSTRKEPSVIARSSFEETMDNYLQAGVYCQKEEATGNSASILFGQRGIFGTGAMEIAFNIEKLLTVRERQE